MKDAAEFNAQFYVEIERIITAARSVQRGCDCEYDYRCGRCEAIVKLCEAVTLYDAATAAATAAARP